MGKASRRRREVRRSAAPARPVTREAVVPWQGLVRDALAARARAQLLEAEAVRAARLAGVSWRAISESLGGEPTYETLRQRYGKPSSTSAPSAAARAS